MVVDTFREHKIAITAWMIGGIPVIASFIQAINALSGNRQLYWIPLVGDISRTLVSYEVFQTASEIFYSQSSTIFVLFTLIGLSWMAQGVSTFSTIDIDHHTKQQASVGSAVLSGLLYGVLFLGVYSPIFSQGAGGAVAVFLAIPVVAVGSLFYTYYSYSWERIRRDEAVRKLESAKQTAGTAKQRVENRLSSVNTGLELDGPEDFIKECSTVVDEIEESVAKADRINISKLESEANHYKIKTEELAPDDILDNINKASDEFEAKQKEVTSEAGDAKNLAREARQDVRQKAESLGITDSSLNYPTAEKMMSEFISECEDIESESEHLMSGDWQKSVDQVIQRATQLKSRAESLNPREVADEIEDSVEQSNAEIREIESELTDLKSDIKYKLSELYNFSEYPVDELNVSSDSIDEAIEKKDDIAYNFNRLLEDIKDTLDAIDSTDPSALQSRLSRFNSKKTNLESELDLEELNTSIGKGLDEVAGQLSRRLDLAAQIEGDTYSIKRLELSELDLDATKYDVIQKTVQNKESLQDVVTEVVEELNLGPREHIILLNSIDESIINISEYLNKNRENIADIKQETFEYLDKMESKINQQDGAIKQQMEQIYIHGEYPEITSVSDVENGVDEAWRSHLKCEFDAARDSIVDARDMAKEGAKILRQFDGVFLYKLQNGDEKIDSMPSLDSYRYDFYSSKVFELLKPAVFQEYGKQFDWSRDPFEISINSADSTEIDENLKEEIHDDSEDQAPGLEVKYLLDKLRRNFNDQITGASYLQLEEVPEHIKIQNPWEDLFKFISSTDDLTVVTIPEDTEESSYINDVVNESDFIPTDAIEEGDSIVIGPVEDSIGQEAFNDVTGRYVKWANN